MLDSTLANALKLFKLKGQIVTSWGEHWTLVQAIKEKLINNNYACNVHWYLSDPTDQLNSSHKMANAAIYREHCKLNSAGRGLHTMFGGWPRSHRLKEVPLDRGLPTSYQHVKLSG
jgi:hypothetical protein